MVEVDFIHLGNALKRILNLPRFAQSYFQDTRVAEHYDTAVRTRLNVIIGITFSIEIRTNLVTRNVQLCTDCIHTTMRKAVLYRAKTVECCTNHNVIKII